MKKVAYFIIHIIWRVIHHAWGLLLAVYQSIAYFIHHFAFRCKGNKFISFSDKKSGKLLDEAGIIALVLPVFVNAHHGVVVFHNDLSEFSTGFSTVEF